MQKKEEGFDDSDNEHLPSKAKDNGFQQPKTETQDYYKIPEAKPILSKDIIDADKPKVLIKEIEYFKQPPELLTSNMHK